MRSKITKRIKRFVTMGLTVALIATSLNYDALEARATESTNVQENLVDTKTDEVGASGAPVTVQEVVSGEAPVEEGQTPVVEGQTPSADPVDQISSGDATVLDDDLLNDLTLESGMTNTMNISAAKFAVFHVDFYVTVTDEDGKAIPNASVTIVAKSYSFADDKTFTESTGADGKAHFKFGFWFDYVEGVTVSADHFTTETNNSPSYSGILNGNSGSASIKLTHIYTIDYVCDPYAVSADAVTSYKKNDKVVLPGLKTDYRMQFTGWYTDAACTNKITEIAAGTTGNLTLYAGFNYRAALYLLKASTTPKTEVTGTGACTEYDEDEFLKLGVVYFNVNGIGNNKTFTEIQDQNDPNYAADSSKVEGLIITSANMAGCTGFTYDSASGALSYEEGGVKYFTNLQNINWYVIKHVWTDTNTNFDKYNIDGVASWTENVPVQYTLKYVVNDGTLTGSDTQTFTVNDAITFEVPAKDGCTFDGWYTTPDFQDGTLQTGIAVGTKNDATVYAKWTENPAPVPGPTPGPTPEVPDIVYTVKFVDGLGNTLSTQSVVRGYGATAPEVPARTGFTFTAWDTAFRYVYTDLTVTAQYTEVQEVVAHVQAPQAPAVINDENTPLAEAPVEEPAEAPAVDEPEKTVEEVKAPEEEKEQEVVAIDDEDTPLASGTCNIHWLILLLTAIYTVFELVRSVQRNKKIKENDAETAEA